MRVGLVVLVGAALCGVGGSARAGANDFRLNGVDANGRGILFSCEPRPCAPDEQAFRSFATELGFLLAPRLASPAGTLGVAGFEVGFAWSGHFVSNEDHWLLTEDGQSTEDASSFFQTLQLEVRKGLPLSFEVGATLAWLADSQIFAPGLDLRWAFQEGYAFLPDFAVRAAVSSVVGSPDLSLTMLTTDLVISKGLPVGGLASLSPYVSLGAVFTAASSDVIDPTPTELDPRGDPPVLAPDVENDIAFERLGLADEVYAKVTAGLRARFSIVDVLLQGELMMFRDGEVVGPVGTVTSKLALAF